MRTFGEKVDARAVAPCVKVVRQDIVLAKPQLRQIKSTIVAEQQQSTRSQRLTMSDQLCVSGGGGQQGARVAPRRSPDQSGRSARRCRTWARFYASPRVAASKLTS